MTAVLVLSDQGVQAMARVAKPTKSTKPVASKRKPGRPATQAAKPAPKASKATKPTTAAASRRASAAATPAPKLSVGELRLLVEKLERNEATLRAKNREAGRAVKTAAARINELEQRVAGLEAEATKQTATAKPGPKPALMPATRAKRRSQGVDPGDAVPPGVAVVEPPPLDAEAEAAREKLEHLGGE